MALPSLSQRTPRESPTLATVNSLSDSRATRHVVPETEGAEGDQRQIEKKEMEQWRVGEKEVEKSHKRRESIIGVCHMGKKIRVCIVLYSSHCRKNHYNTIFTHTKRNE